jgi:hypothetical protein
MLQVRKSALAITDWRQKDRVNSSWGFCIAWIKSDTLAANGEGMRSRALFCMANCHASGTCKQHNNENAFEGSVRFGHCHWSLKN